MSTEDTRYRGRLRALDLLSTNAQEQCVQLLICTYLNMGDLTTKTQRLIKLRPRHCAYVWVNVCRGPLLVHLVVSGDKDITISPLQMLCCPKMGVEHSSMVQHLLYVQSLASSVKSRDGHKTEYKAKILMTWTLALLSADLSTCTNNKVTHSL